MILAGSPCQSLSITQSKTRQGLNGKSKPFFEFMDILNHVRQFNPDVKFLFENVDSMSNESRTAIESCLGEKLVYQNSNAFSAQDRARVYATNFEWIPKNEPCDLVLKDILEKEDCVVRKEPERFTVKINSDEIEFLTIEFVEQYNGTSLSANIVFYPESESDKIFGLVTHGFNVRNLNTIIPQLPFRKYDENQFVGTMKDEIKYGWGF